MIPIGSINPGVSALPLERPQSLGLALPSAGGGAAGSTQAPGGFTNMLDGLVSMVDGKSAQAQDLTSKVLLGDSDQLHQSVIAMQEASTAFSLMIQVRNKLVDSYQELMRMQV
jgi:flagellar hook-basal body complex protein FliE